MCGIAGIYSYKGLNLEKNINLIQKINKIQKHRGPDDDGIFQDPFCILGHTRLSIIDLSKDGHQPFASDDGRYQMVYNGEIFNYIELREELTAKGRIFKTKSDTEVLLKYFLEYGFDCLSKLNGMFSFIIYDSQDRKIYLARDRFGIKPIYYSILDSIFYFASEIKALINIPSIKKTINEKSLFEYLVFNRTDVYDETFINEIKRLPKGCYGTVDKDKINLNTWWNPDDFLNKNHNLNVEDVEKKIKELFISSIQLRMRSDVPVGSCLSGGLDSSIIIGVLFDEYQVKDGYPTFSAVFPEHYLDESNYIRQLNQKYPFLNYKTHPNCYGAFKDLSKFVYVNDEPTTNYSFYSQFKVMELAKENRITVLLDGQGGDENFAGYQYFHGFYLYGLWKKNRFHKFGKELIKCLKRRQHISAYQIFLYETLPDPLKKLILVQATQYLKPDFIFDNINSSPIFTKFLNSRGLNESLSQHFKYKLEHLLRIEDRNSMAFSIEARVPYLDYRLVEFMLSISEDLKITMGETKWLQKKSLGCYSIPEIIDRKDKIGFGTPGKEWMNDSLWRTLAMDCSIDLQDTFPYIFKKEDIHKKEIDYWKLIQLKIWKDLFLS